MSHYCLIVFTARSPSVIGPFDSEFAATHYHDTHFGTTDTVLLMPMITPQGEMSGNEAPQVDTAERGNPQEDRSV